MLACSTGLIGTPSYVIHLTLYSAAISSTVSRNVDTLKTFADRAGWVVKRCALRESGVEEGKEEEEQPHLLEYWEGNKIHRIFMVNQTASNRLWITPAP